MLKNIINRTLGIVQQVNYGVVVRSLPIGIAVLATSIGMIKAVQPNKPVMSNPIFMVINNYYVRGPKHAKINK